MTAAPPTEPAEAEDDSPVGLERRLNRRFPGYRFGALLVLLIATFVFMSAGLSGNWVPLVTVILESITLLVALSAARAGHHYFVISLVAIAVGLFGSVVVLVGDVHHVVSFTYGVSAALVLLAPIAIVHGIIERRVVDARTVAGALCVYVFIGMFFSFVYAILQDATGRSFFVQTSHGSTAILLYFSFTCLTTVGFGDFTAASGLGRSLSVLEAMAGQLYLVTVVALLVSNLRPAMSRLALPPGEAGASATGRADPPAPPPAGPEPTAGADGRQDAVASE